MVNHPKMWSILKLKSKILVKFMVLKFRYLKIISKFGKVEKLLKIWQNLCYSMGNSRKTFYFFKSCLELCTNLPLISSEIIKIS